MQWTSEQYLGFVGLMEVSQAQAVILGTAFFNTLPFGCHINVFMQSLASFLHEIGKVSLAAAQLCLTVIRAHFKQ